MSDFTYEIKKESEGDVMGSTITKNNISIDFTLAELEGEQKNMAKMLTETRGQMDTELAKMKNVMNFHEDAVSLVKSLDPVKQKAVHIWLDSKLKIDELGPLKDKLVDAIRKGEEEMQEIVKQVGIELPESYTPIDLNGTPTNEEIINDILEAEVTEEGESEGGESGKG